MNIHVGNLPLQATENDLRALFQPFGTVQTVQVITNPRSGEPLGYGFVIMLADAEGEKAAEALNGKPWMGKALMVSKAHRKEGARRGGRRRDRGFRSQR